MGNVEITTLQEKRNELMGRKSFTGE